VRSARWVAVAVVLVATCALAGCNGDKATLQDTASGTSSSRSPAPSASSSASTPTTSFAVAPPAKFDGRIRTPDMLITGEQTLPASLVRRIAALHGVAGVLPFSIASDSINGRTLQVAAVDADTFRSFMPVETAQANFVWDRLAGGEIAVDNGVSKQLIGKGDLMRLGTSSSSPELHVGAYAPLMQPLAAGWGKQPWVQVAVNQKVGERLGMRKDNALLVSTGSATPSAVEKPVKRIIGGTKGVALKVLALQFDAGSPNTAVLTGESVTKEVGTFSYTNGPGGTIIPESSWVHNFIRTETVPIIGQVTCNKGMLPQLIGALSEIQALGLADKIHPSEYGGCYVPRYINHNPADGLSLHSWGIAVDLNVPENQRGTAGQMDPVVVQTFKKWGFAWGGDWHYTDPMHFEMDKVVRAVG
jgi:hypothetical protein